MALLENASDDQLFEAKLWQLGSLETSQTIMKL